MAALLFQRAVAGQMAVLKQMGRQLVGIDGGGLTVSSPYERDALSLV